jgi:hypothetical protein
MGQRWLALVAACIAVSAGSARAQTDPNQEFAITPEVGPWTICAASPFGEGAGQRARALVMELRSRYHVQAYLYDRGAEMRRQQQEELEQRRQRQREYLIKNGLDPNIPLRTRTVRVEEQFAVLVGGYSSMEAARRELDRIKRLTPPQSIPKDVVFTQHTTAAGAKPETHQSEVNPFTNSFVVPNPCVPHDTQAASKPDPFWKQLNSGESYSLLKCKKPWTLVVKEFPGTAIIEPKSAPSFLEKVFGRSMGEELSANAMNAHNLAEALHKAGFDEVYVLHTRGSSIVSIGGFDRKDDPRMQQLERALQSFRFEPNLDLFARPMPMEVPRL